MNKSFASASVARRSLLRSLGAGGVCVFLCSLPLPAAELVLHWGLNDGVADPASFIAEDDGQDALTPGVDPDNSRDGGFVSFGSPAIQPLWQTSGGVKGSGYLHFDGSPDVSNGYGMRYVESGGSLPSGPAYSISQWFRVHPNGAAGEMGGLLSGLFTTANNRYFEVDAWYSFDGANTVINTITATHRGTGFASAASPDTPGYFDGNWHHVVSVFSSTSLRSLYVDGVLVASNTTAANTAVDPVRFTIGALDRPSVADYFSGDMDEISVYRGELTEAEINTLFKGTNPDSDGDGITDTWETAHGLNVGVNDAALDPDHDTLSNLQEFQASTDPQSADTDSDGLADPAEIVAGTNPNLADTDGDELSDGAEVNTHHTSPLLSDTDADGFTDSYELLENTNPSDAGSFPPPLRLALHWSLNNGSGSTAADDGQDPLTPGADTSKSRHGEYAGFNHAAGAPLWMPSGGVNNSGYLHFDGDENAAAGYVMRYLDPGSQLPAGGYSVSLWFHISAASAGGGCAALVNFAGGGSPGGLYYQAGAYPGIQAQLNHRNGNPAGEAQIVTGATFNYGQWHHLVTVFASDSSRTLYVDGVVYGENTVTRGLINPDRFSIGALDRPTTADRFDGDIDEVHLYVGELLPPQVLSLFAAGQTDTDADGLPDTWEAGYGLSIGANDAEADADGDGQSNLAEFRADTNPASSADALLLEFSTAGGSPALTFNRKSTRGYILQRSDNLTSWENVLDFPAGTEGGLTETPVSTAGPRNYYRVRSYVP